MARTINSKWKKSGKVGIGLFGLIVGLVLTAAAQQVTGTRPNILIINVDDMGWRDAGFMGSKYYDTPVMDRLSKQGTIFKQAYAAASNCAPSRACMMTGLWTPRHGIYTVGNADRGESKDRKLIPIKNNETLNPRFTTLASALHNTGYQTCMAGKWHLSDDPKPYGFDVNIGGSHAGAPASYYPPYKNVKLEGDNTKYLTDAIMDRVVNYVDTLNSKKPFFLYYATYAVHSPIQGVDSLMHLFKDKPANKGQANATYATMLKNEDRNIGRLLTALEKKGVLNNTLIIFTSDNGGLNKVTWQKPLRAGKGSYFEGGIRVPMVFVWKNHIKAGSTSEMPVTNLDFYPTLMAVAGTKTPVKTDGDNLLPYLLKQNSGSQLASRTLYWYFPIYLEGGNKETNDRIFRTRPGEALRKGDWKLHHYFEDDSYQLYNLKQDVGEQHNLIATYPSKTDELKKALQDIDRQVNAPAVTKLNPAYGK